jgi:hypothetical protein
MRYEDLVRDSIARLSKRASDKGYTEYDWVPSVIAAIISATHIESTDHVMPLEQVRDLLCRSTNVALETYLIPYERDGKIRSVDEQSWTKTNE